MLELKDISFQYGSDSEMTENLSNISISIAEGEVVVFTGESGCGKTTLARVLNGLCPNFYEGTLSGEYQINGNNSRNLSIGEIGLLIGSVFQDPRTQFFATNSTDELVLAMENRGFSPEKMRENLHKVVSEMGIEALLDRNMFTLSSGEKQKIAIASACMVQPKVLLLDEPSSNLDSASIEKLKELLKHLKSEGFTVVIFEHRLYYLRELMDAMVVMKNGRIIRKYNRNQLGSLTDEEMAYMGLRKLNIPVVQSVKATCQGDSTKVAASMRHVTYRVRQNSILKDINLEIVQGEIVVLTGLNGAGKTTTCRILSGLLRESSGHVEIAGQICNRHKRVKQTFLVQQDSDYQLYTANVYDEITLGVEPTAATKDEVQRLLECLHLEELAARHPGALSDGQKQRVLLAAAMLSKKKLLILDEPTSGLDGRHMRELARLLRKIARTGTAILLITHDLEFAELVGDSEVRIADGQTQEKRRII